MGTYEKELRSICENPKNVRFQTLRKILLDLGFKERKGKDFIYTYQGHILYVPSHGKNSLLKEVYVKKACKLLRELGVFDQED